jgi:tripartite-type tricarboxylate transporter receptor subunit TctC
VVSSTWWGIGVPVKTPKAVQAKLRSPTANTLTDPDYVARLAAMAVEPMVMTPEQARFRRRRSAQVEDRRRGGEDPGRLIRLRRALRASRW